MWGIIQSVVVVFALFAFMTSIVAQLAYLGLRGYFSRLTPERRARNLVLLACSPVSVAAVMVVILFIPSFMTLVGLAVDHCLVHGDHHEHFCFIHPPAFITNPWTILFSAVVLATTLWRMIQAHQEILAGQKLLSQLRRNCDKQQDYNYRVIESEKIIACSMGFLNPEIFISRSLTDHLSHEELRAVIAHEKAHAKRKDFLTLFLAKIFSAFFYSKLANKLLSDINLASEQACDEIASKELGSAVLVANTIVKVQKRMPDDSLLMIPAMHFSQSHIVQRVMLLVSQNHRKNLHNGIFPKYIVMGTALVFLLFNYQFIHHYVETLYFSLFR